MKSSSVRTSYSLFSEKIVTCKRGQLSDRILIVKANFRADEIEFVAPCYYHNIVRRCYELIDLERGWVSS